MLNTEARKAIILAALNNVGIPKELKTEEGCQFDIKARAFLALFMAADNAFDVKLTDLTSEIAITWSVEDVREERPDLSDEQAMKVLDAIMDSDAAATGVNFETVISVADKLYPEKQGEGEEEVC